MRPPFRPAASDNRTVEHYHPGHPLGPIALGGLAVSAGLAIGAAHPYLASRALQALSSWSIRYAERHPSVSRFRGPFWISQEVSRLAGMQTGGVLADDVAELMFRREAVDALLRSTASFTRGLSREQTTRFHSIIQEMFTTRTRVRSLMHEQPADVFRAFGLSEFASIRRAMLELGITDQDQLLQQMATAIAAASRTARTTASQMDYSAAANVIRELGRQDILRGSRPSPLLSLYLRRAGYQQMNMEQIIQAGMFLTSAEEAAAAREGFMRGAAIDIQAMHRRSLEDMALRGPEELRPYYEVMNRNFYGLYRHLHAIVGAENINPIYRSTPRGVTLVGWRISDEGMRMLRSTQATGMFLGSNGRVLDLSYVMPAVHDILTRFSVSVGVPLSPFLASLNPLRLFPWYRPMNRWFQDIGYSAKQFGLAAAMGIQPHEPLGTQLYMFGGRAYELAVPGIGESGEVALRELPGRWNLLGIRGESMERMVAALTGNRNRPDDRSLLWRLLDIGQQDEVSWWSKAGSVIRGLLGQREPTDPASVLQRLVSVDPTRLSQVELAELAQQVEGLYGFVSSTATFDELKVAARFGDILVQTGDPVLKNWGELFQEIGKLKSEEELAAYFRSGMGDSTATRLLSALVYENPHDPILASFGYAVDPLSSSILEVQPFSEQLRTLTQMRTYLYAWMEERRSPYRMPTPIDPIPETALGQPDAQLNARKLLRAMLMEPIGYVGSISDDQARDVMIAEMSSQLVQASMDAGGPEAAAWAVMSLFHEALQTQDLLTTRRVLGSLGQRLRSGMWAFDTVREHVARYRRWYHIWEDLGGDEYGRLGTRVLAVKSYDDIPEWWNRYRQYAKDYARFFFTGDPQSLNAFGLQSYFFAWRLNEMLQPYGLGLSSRHLGSPFSIYSNLFLRRVLPVWMGVEAWKYVNTVSDEYTGTSPAEIGAAAWERVHVGVTRLMDLFGITSLKKSLVSFVPGLDRYFTPRNAEELQRYYRYGYATVRRGRGWLVASRTPVVGESVEAYVPPWTRAARSNWQAASNVDTSGIGYFMRGDSPLPTPHNPLAPLFYLVRRLTGMRERSWMQRHRYDRPYPGVEYYVDDRPAFRPTETSVVSAPVYIADGGYAPGSPAAVLTAMLHRYTAADRVRDIAGSRRFHLGPGFARAQDTQGTGERVAESRMRAAGSAAIQADRMGMPGVFGILWPGGGMAGGAVTQSDIAPGYGRSAVAAQLKSTASTPNLLDTALEYKHELHGLYGWFTSSLLGLRGGSVSMDYPDWAISFSRRLWETRIGGLDVLPWQSELNEFYRRWFHRRKASEVRVNPLPNNMPIWLPERFWFGDPYASIPMGELRLPGEAYRRLNPEGFRTPLMRMRASMLGATEEEMLAYLTGLEEDIDETRATRFGTREHKRIQRYLRRLGVLEGEEVFVYDKEHNISGHIDVIMRARNNQPMIVEIKTVGQNKWDQIGDKGIYKHYIQLQQYLHTTGIERGGLLYINRDDPSQVRFIPARLDERALREAWARLERVRGFLQEQVASGRLHEGYLYPDLVKFEILSDVAPKSRQWYQMKRRVEATADQLTEDERIRYEQAKQRAEAASKRYVTTPYRNIPLERRSGRLTGISPSGRLLVETADGNVVRLKLAGMEWSRSGLQQVADPSTPLPERVARYLRRLGIREGDQVQYLTSQRLGRVDLINRPHDTAILLDRRGRWVNRLALRQGVAQPDEDDQSDEAVRMRQGVLERAMNWLGDRIAHADTPLNTKFLKVRSPLEEWKRSFVFGNISGSWFSPVSSYLIPAVQSSILASNPVMAGLKMGGLASLFALTRRGKLRAFGYGAAAGAALSTLSYLTGTHGRPPGRTRKRWEVEEYADMLEYIKYRRLYEYEKQLAKAQEGFDIDKLLESVEKHGDWMRELRIQLRTEQAEEMQKTIYRAKDMQRELERRGRNIGQQQMYRELSRRQRQRFAQRRRAMQASSVIDMYLGEHAKRAILYREMYLSTAYGAATDERSLRRLLRTVPARYRQLYQEVLETGSRAERREFLRLIPEYQQRLFAKWLDPDAQVPDRRDMLQLLRRYGLPGPNWEGWRPDVDIRPLIAPLLRREGIDPTSAAVFPGQQAIGEELARLMGLPKRNVTRAQVLDTLSGLFGGRDAPMVLQSITTPSRTDSVHISLQVEDDTDDDVLSQLLDEYSSRYG